MSIKINEVNMMRWVGEYIKHGWVRIAYFAEGSRLGKAAVTWEKINPGPTNQFTISQL